VSSVRIPVGRAEQLDHQCDVDQDLQSDEQDEEGQIELDLAYSHRRDDASKQANRRIRERVDEFGNQEKDPAWLPRSREHLHEVEDETADKDQPVQPQRRGKNLPDDSHPDNPLVRVVGDGIRGA
jgi:hypothetical protein